MKRAELLVVLALSGGGCMRFSHRPPPGPREATAPWRPAAELEERLPHGNDGEVLLDDRDGLSPDEAAVLAIRNHPRLRAARAERGTGEAELLRAGLLANPEVETSLSFPLSGEDASVVGYEGGVTWELAPLYSRGAEKRSAEENLLSLDLDIAWEEWLAAQSARLHAIRAIYLARRAEVAKEIERTWSERLNSLRDARSANAVTELAVVAAERSYAEARVERLGLEQELASERTELHRSIAVDPEREIVLDLSFQPSEEKLDRALLLDGLPERRLDLLALQRAHRSHDEAARAAVLAQFPPVAIGFQSTREVDGVASAGVLLNVEIPLFDRNQSAVTRETSERTRIEAEYEARLLDARADVIRSLQEIELLREQLAASRDAARAARRLADLARTAVRSGALSQLQAAEILESSSDSRLRVLRIESSLAELEVALSLAAGTSRW